MLTVRCGTVKSALRSLGRVPLAAMLLVSSGALAGGGSGFLELSAGIHRIEAEVVATPSDRARGLMHRKSLPASRGMIFAFPESGRHCMWMRNTLIPLAVAFIDADGVIINVAEMQPHSLDNHCADGVAKYALEMNGGWFRSRGIGSGTKLGGLERTPTAR